ncbi:MAG: hypothetical protein OHK0017_09460 [Patescibacteria group bacterium]
MFRTRFAPSPTGYLHLGSARTTLFAKLFALHNEGVFYLRLEDTDRKRLLPDAFSNLLNALDRVGLQANEGVTLAPNGDPDDFYGVWQTGDYGPYIQSERLSLYHEHAQNLIDRKLAYWSYLTDSDKQELQEIKQTHKRPINYFLENLKRLPKYAGVSITPEILTEAVNDPDLFASVETGLTNQNRPALMYRLQRDSKIKCQDGLLGETEFDLSLEEDFVVLKSDGFPTYHLAHLVDDKLMETSMVVRAQEWFPSISKHTAMFRDYWGQEPQYVHIPFVLGETGNKKMSKRDGNVNMQDYLDKGYLPEAIINYLAFLGWNPGTEKEIYLEKADFDLPLGQRLQKLMKNIAEDFSLDKLSKSPARFNIEKLNWFNREYIKMMSLEEFALRGAKNHLQSVKTDATLRVGDYVYLVDFKTNKAFSQIVHAPETQDSPYYHQMGGGRDEGENALQSLTRELLEESAGKVQIDRDKLIPFTSLSFSYNEPREHQGVIHDGKQMNFYFHPLDFETVTGYTIDEFGQELKFDWVELPELISSNRYITYPIWQEFCTKNGFECFAPTEKIKQQYLAWYLDKQRVTLLSELGTDSQTILNWELPSPDLVKWKKITQEESLANLDEINNFIQHQLENKTEANQFQNKLYETVFSPDLDLAFESSVMYWESTLKNWLSENGKDTGSYLWPLRVALSGKSKSPSPFELLSVLNPKQVKERLQKVLNR